MQLYPLPRGTVYTILYYFYTVTITYSLAFILNYEMKPMHLDSVLVCLRVTTECPIIFATNGLTCKHVQSMRVKADDFL